MDLAFDCRVCKKNTVHKVVTVTDKLPANVHVLECIACGVLGVRMLSDEVANG
jgi:transcription elongation factor Elf1